MKQEFNITKLGKEELEAELELLISQRKEISEEVATARDFARKLRIRCRSKKTSFGGISNHGD